jgi:hypothetical protein
MNSLSKVDFIETNNVLKIHSIAAISFNTLSRQKDVKIFVVFMKNLNIQLKKQESNVITDLKSIVLIEYHDFLNVFSKKKVDVLSSHRKHDHRIELEEKKNSRIRIFIQYVKERTFVDKEVSSRTFKQRFYRVEYCIIRISHFVCKEI